MEHAEEVQRIGMAGPLLQDPLVECRRRRRLARPMMAERSPKGMVDRVDTNRRRASGLSLRPAPLASRHRVLRCPHGAGCTCGRAATHPLYASKSPEAASKSVMRVARNARPTRAPTVTGSCTSMLTATYSRLTKSSSAPSSATKAMMTPP